MGEHQFLKKLESFYDKHYKGLVVITQVMLFLALFQIGFQVVKTGDFINKGISLKGGITVTVSDNQKTDISTLEKVLEQNFPKNDINVRSLAQAGAQSGVVVDADFDIKDQASVDKTLAILNQFYGKEIKDYSVENISPSLSAGFFRQVALALVIAFIFMGIVVVVTFRTAVPSLAVILCGFSDIVETIAIVNLTGMKLGTASIAAFLMLIGYSVDTDILLTTKVVKQKVGTIIERVWRAIKTGLTMTMTTLGAVAVGLIFTQSDSIRQIMIIILIGLVIDMFNTWIQNVAILRWYQERKEHKHESQS
jgi:preprotein translocase subunit SecF